MSVSPKNPVTFFTAPARDYGALGSVEESSNFCIICQSSLYEPHVDNLFLPTPIAYHTVFTKNSEKPIYHGFHLPCIKQWFVSQPTCPLCRDTVSNVTNLVPRRILYRAVRVLVLGAVVSAAVAVSDKKDLAEVANAAVAGAIAAAIGAVAWKVLAAIWMALPLLTVDTPDPENLGMW